MRGDYRPTYRPLAIHRNASMAPIGDERHDPSLRQKAGESARGTARRVERNAGKRVRYDGDADMRAKARERARAYHQRRKAALAAETAEQRAVTEATVAKRHADAREPLEALLAEMGDILKGHARIEDNGSRGAPDLIIEI